MPRAEVNHIEISYKIHGDGEALLLIGGYGMVKESWDLQASYFSRYFRVITFDNRGVGESSIPAQPYTIADMAADTVALLDVLKIKAVNIFGVSMGGLIAQVLSLDFPDRVKKVVLGCTTHGGRHAIPADAEAMGILAETSNSDIEPAEAMKKKVPILFSSDFIRNCPEKLENFIRLNIKYWPTSQGAEGQFKALSVFNSKRRLGEIKSPVLLITGTEDKIIPPQNSELLVNGITSRARLHRVHGAGHSFFLEKPDEVNKAIHEFFKAP